MNCKPGQLAMIVRESFGKPCSRWAIGVPVRVVAQTMPCPFDGPMWRLESPVKCPNREALCFGILHMPDACLLPFDPASEPEAEPAADTAPAMPDYMTGQGA